jgi:hypothetical protein
MAAGLSAMAGALAPCRPKEAAAMTSGKHVMASQKSGRFIVIPPKRE